MTIIIEPAAAREAGCRATYTQTSFNQTDQDGDYTYSASGVYYTVTAIPAANWWFSNTNSHDVLTTTLETTDTPIHSYVRELGALDDNNPTITGRRDYQYWVDNHRDNHDECLIYHSKSHVTRNYRYGSYFSNVTWDMDTDTITVTFTNVPPEYRVSLSVSPSGAGSTTGAGLYTAGTECTISQSANENYTFLYWEKDDGTTIASSSYTFNVDRDVSFIAKYKLKEYGNLIVRTHHCQGASPIVSTIVVGNQSKSYSDEIEFTKAEKGATNRVTVNYRGAISPTFPQMFNSPAQYAVYAILTVDGTSGQKIDKVCNFEYFYFNISLPQSYDVAYLDIYCLVPYSMTWDAIGHDDLWEEHENDYFDLEIYYYSPLIGWTWCQFYYVDPAPFECPPSFVNQRCVSRVRVKAKSGSSIPKYVFKFQEGFIDGHLSDTEWSIPNDDNWHTFDVLTYSSDIGKDFEDPYTHDPIGPFVYIEHDINNGILYGSVSNAILCDSRGILYGEKHSEST